MARKKPIPRSARKELNRGRIRSRNDDTVKQISVGLMDIDAAIMFYFNNTIQPMVEENGESIKVPLMYSNPERWAMVQKRGYLLDNKKQLIIPLIAFKRTSIEKDDAMPVDKIDPLNPKLFYTFQKQYSDKNRYDKFSANFYKKVQKAFVKIGKSNMKRYVILDNSKDTPEIEKIILKKIMKLLNK